MAAGACSNVVYSHFICPWNSSFTAAPKGGRYLLSNDSSDLWFRLLMARRDVKLQTSQNSNDVPNIKLNDVKWYSRYEWNLNEQFKERVAERLACWNCDRRGQELVMNQLYEKESQILAVMYVTSSLWRKARVRDILFWCLSGALWFLNWTAGVTGLTNRRLLKDTSNTERHEGFSKAVSAYHARRNSF